MMRRPTYLLLASVLTLFFATTAWIAAEPLFPRRAPLPIETRSLRGLKEVGVIVDPLPPEVNFTEEQVMEIVRATLATATIKVSDDPKLPTIVFSVAAAHDFEQPEIIAFAIVPSVRQSVTVDRLETQMTVPTFTGMILRVTRKDRSHKHFKQELNRCLNHLIKLIREASDETQRIDEPRS